MKRFRYQLVQFLVKNLLKAVTEDEILLIAGKDFIYNKRKLTASEVDGLRLEAVSFQKTILWKLLTKEIRWQASMRMVEKSTTPDDMVFGKAMIYNLSLIEKFIEQLQSL